MPVVRDVYCAAEQKVLPHFVSIDKASRELLMKCQGKCKHFIKFPPTITPGEVTDFLKKYEEANKGQVLQTEEAITLSAEREEEILREFSNPNS